MTDAADPRAPRVSPLEERDAYAAAEAAGIPRGIADLNIFRVLLRQPRLARTLHDLLMALLAGEHLDPRLRELVIMRIGWATGSAYEWTQHWRIARVLGVDDDDLLAVRDWRDATRFGSRERAVLAATDEMLALGRLGAGTWSECEAALGGSEELLELVAVIGLWSMVSELLETLQVPLEDGVEAWPPDGVVPDPGRALD